MEDLLELNFHFYYQKVHCILAEQQNHDSTFLFFQLISLRQKDRNETFELSEKDKDELFNMIQTTDE